MKTITIIKPTPLSSFNAAITGDVRYIYHGNDGTSFPWNDAAQLDYTKAEVREAIIQTIFACGAKFPCHSF
ncbi:MAG: hypothetical protein U0X87_11380 [Anaerolineales bacterium]